MCIPAYSSLYPLYCDVCNHIYIYIYVLFCSLYDYLEWHLEIFMWSYAIDMYVFYYMYILYISHASYML